MIVGQQQLHAPLMTTKVLMLITPLNKDQKKFDHSFP